MGIPRPPATRVLLAALATLFIVNTSVAIELQRKGTGTHNVLAVVIIGDREAVYDMKGWHEYERSILAAKISPEDIETIGNYLLRNLKDHGYVFAQVSHHAAALSADLLAYKVSVGNVGNISVVGNRHYTAEQILKNIDTKKGGRFNYRDLYSNLFDLNVKPDISVDTTLDPKDGNTVDVELKVQDSIPLHLGVNLSNTGTSSTGDWRVRTTLQHLNLTKNDDALSVEWLTDPSDVDSINAISSSYRLPLGARTSLSVFGGWSESDIDDILPELDVFGQGYFGGLRLSRVLKSTNRYNIDAGAGWTYQFVENAVDLADVPFERREVRLSMPNITLGYAEKLFDKLGGRNFMSASMLWHFEDNLGGSDEADFLRHQANADASLFITKLRAARLQRLSTLSESALSQWTLFLKLNSQFSDDVLIPALQHSIGGADSVRGYREREMAGDAGVTATVELRTPLMSNFIPGLKHEGDEPARSDRWQAHRLQLVAFADLGYVYRNDPVPGLSREDSINSVGLGLRMNLSKYWQMKVDYGFPLAETVESDEDGRGHVSLQAQF